MRGHLQCRDTLAWNEGCPLKTGTTVSRLLVRLMSRCELSVSWLNSMLLLHSFSDDPPGNPVMQE